MALVVLQEEADRAQVVFVAQAVQEAALEWAAELAARKLDPAQVEEQAEQGSDPR